MAKWCKVWLSNEKEKIFLETIKRAMATMYCVISVASAAPIAWYFRIRKILRIIFKTTPVQAI